MTITSTNGGSGVKANPWDAQRQVARAFSASDVETLLDLPEIEVKYRLLRNEWLTSHSALKQAQEREAQAVRSKNLWEIEDARKAVAAAATTLGVYKRMTILARTRAEAEIFKEIAERILPTEVRMLINNAVEGVIRRDNREVTTSTGQHVKLTVEDYEAFDALLTRWTAKPEGVAA